MGFNTAVFYDIENLLKGYSFSQQIIANLSLKEILEAVRRTGKVGQIAVQRAYANWSDPRLAIMRGEINELGIDPIQVFGFSRKKNAADIQLAIDAVDLAHIRPALEVFVIVSGDGGFASLAKKLHEYGKTVIGCAYRSSANKTFQSVCDDFVLITDPDEEEEEQQHRAVSQGSKSDQPEVTDPRNVRLVRQVRRLAVISPENIVAKTKEVLDWYSRDPTCRADLVGDGIYLSVVQEALKYTIPGFQPVRLGFAKFVEYMQFACKGSDFCIARAPNSQPVLVFRRSIRSGTEVLPDLDARELHSVDTYRSILATGGPVFRLPSPNDLYAVMIWLAQNPIQETDLGTVIERIVSELGDTVSSESVKLALLSLLSSGVFKREPEGVPLSEQRLSLRSDVQSPATMLAMLRAALQEKLVNVLSEVKEDVLQLLLPEVVC